jgi:flagellar protein FlbT
MAGLVLKLAPGERILINGLMFENGPKKARITLHAEGAHVLRLRDALHPNQIGGPVSIAYHHAQLAVAGESAPEAAVAELRPRLDDLAFALEGTWAMEALGQAREALEASNFYRMMRALHPLLPLERELLGTTV